MLRNESPVFARILINDPVDITLNTGLEPIGEGEDIVFVDISNEDKAI